ncbi:hypothetical protein K443DRAFT_7150 [Laccaria amethystina LaAM-08-1]|uniref:Uncharacterized protein n=1 Tax=Laccaria amethystina LaAM-08-1 TaxID=1095629 RepID=A0A0C9X7R8_9AGAR|nr:hypothetical protein K443DRAFT_7150 [Laccaria amethystina LaAM-08-1]
MAAIHCWVAPAQVLRRTKGSESGLGGSAYCKDIPLNDLQGASKSTTEAKLRRPSTYCALTIPSEMYSQNLFFCVSTRSHCRALRSLQPHQVSNHEGTSLLKALVSSRGSKPPARPLPKGSMADLQRPGIRPPFF